MVIRNKIINKNKFFQIKIKSVLTFSHYKSASYLKLDKKSYNYLRGKGELIIFAIWILHGG